MIIDDKCIDDKSIYHLVMTNIANWKIHDKWRCLAGEIICKWAMAAMAMLNNQRVHFAIF